jgi:hypothetical protein
MEGYWKELTQEDRDDGYTPTKGDLARLITLQSTPQSTPTVCVCERRPEPREVLCLLLADLDERRVKMLLEGDDDQRRGLVEPIRTSHEDQDTVELLIPDDDLVPLAGGEGT